MAHNPTPTCWCGKGCTGKASLTDPRDRSERDTIAHYLDRFGPLPVYADGALESGEEPLYYIESLDDPRIEHPGTAKKQQGENRPADPERQAREAEALAYVRGYHGTWGLPLDIRADRRWDTKYMRLSDRQIEVLLKGKERDEARQKERKQTGRDLNALPYGRTCAAVENAEGGLTFLLIDRPGEKDHYGQPNRWHGWVFVKQQQGPNEVRLGSQRPGESYSGQWPTLIDKVLEDPLAAVRRYGLELGVCGVCQLPLTNAESREYGIGPVCRRRLGY